MEFEKRKQEYLERINADQKMLAEIKERFNNTFDDGGVRLELLTNPKTEKELLIAEPLYTIFSDMLSLAERMETGHVKKIEPEESEGAQVLLEAMKSIMDGNEDVVIFDTKLPARQFAKQIYEVFVAMTDADAISGYIMGKLGLASDEPAEFMINTLRFMSAWLKLFEILKKTKTTPSIDAEVENVTEESIKELNEFKDEFHELCENGKIEKSDTERLADALAEAFTIMFEDNGKHL